MVDLLNFLVSSVGELYGILLAAKHSKVKWCDGSPIVLNDNDVNKMIFLLQERHQIILIFGGTYYPTNGLCVRYVTEGSFGFGYALRYKGAYVPKLFHKKFMLLLKAKYFQTLLNLDWLGALRYASFNPIRSIYL